MRYLLANLICLLASPALAEPLPGTCWTVYPPVCSSVPFRYDAIDFAVVSPWDERASVNIPRNGSRLTYSNTTPLQAYEFLRKMK